MALVHDMAEAIVGDLTPECGICPTDKHRIEEEAMQEMCRLLPASRSQYLQSLFKEYNDGLTNEARMVKQIDKLEFLLQTSEYEAAKGIRLEEFFKNSRHLIEDERLATLLAEIDQERSSR